MFKYGLLCARVSHDKRAAPPNSVEYRRGLALVCAKIRTGEKGPEIYVHKCARVCVLRTPIVIVVVVVVVVVGPRIWYNGVHTVGGGGWQRTRWRAEESRREEREREAEWEHRVCDTKGPAASPRCTIDRRGVVAKNARNVFPRRRRVDGDDYYRYRCYRLYYYLGTVVYHGIVILYPQTPPRLTVCRGVLLYAHKPKSSRRVQSVFVVVIGSLTWTFFFKIIYCKQHEDINLVFSVCRFEDFSKDVDDSPGKTFLFSKPYVQYY